jgi:hypothetical protein
MLAPFVDRLRHLTTQILTDVAMKLYPPRWGLQLADVQALIRVLDERARNLTRQFDERYPKAQVEALPDVHN